MLAPSPIRLAMAVLCVVAFAGCAWVLAGESSAVAIFGRYGPLPFLALLGVGYLAGWGIYCSLGSPPWREKLGRFVLTSATLAMTLALLELPAALGLVDYRQVLPAGGNVSLDARGLNPTWWRFDPELIHRRYPHQRIQGETTGNIRPLAPAARHVYAIDNTYDVNGFRNSIDHRAAAVVLIGDSFIEAGLVAEAQTVAGELRRRFALPVANLGVTMYGPQQELATLRRYGLPLEPRLVVWFLFEGNDLTDATVYETNLEWTRKRLDSYRQRSLLRSVTGSLVDWTSPGPADDAGYLNSCEVRVGAATERMYFAYRGAPLSDVASAGLEMTEDILLTARQAVAEQAAELLFVYVPTKFRVYRDHCVTFPPRGSVAGWTLSDLPGRLRAWSAEQGISFLDLTPELGSRAATEELLYFLDDSHWTALGNRVVAERIVRAVDAHGWLDDE